MKTITIDYNTYLQELSEAHKEGALLTSEIFLAVNKVLATFDDHHYETRYAARRELIEAMKKIETIPSKKLKRQVKK